MPGLDHIDPQGELVRRIHALESTVMRVATLRRQPSPGATIRASNTSQTFTGTSTAGNATQVTLGTVISDTRGMADTANSRIIIPSDGVYLVVYQSGAMEQSADYGFDCLGGLSCRDADGNIIDGTFAEHVVKYGYGRDRSHVAVCPLEAGTVVRLAYQAYGNTLDQLQNPAATGGSTVRFRLTVERLHDLAAS